LVFTVDLPTPGARYRDVRSGFSGLSGLPAFLNQARDGVTHPAGCGMSGCTAARTPWARWPGRCRAASA
jgi:hypothetical protein